MDDMRKGLMHPDSAKWLEMYPRFPSIQEQVDYTKSRLRGMRDDWVNGLSNEQEFRIYCGLLCTAKTLMMWSWNYYPEDQRVQDQEIDDWFMEAFNAE